jgi:hypothetical protein
MKPMEASQDAQVPRLATSWLIALCTAKLLLHVLLSGRYGYFRDELYYLAAARHLDWGYVDFAPLTALYARLGLLLGGSLPAIRIIPAVAGTAVLALTMMITRRLGGGAFAQGLAGLCILVSPAVLAMDNFLSMNAVEPLIWMGAVHVLLAILQTGNSRLWIWFGVLAGIGMQNKHSTAFFCLAVVIALLLSKCRIEFRKPWIWIGGFIALLIFLPNVVWQYRHNFPTLEDLENVRRSGKNLVLGPVAFVWQQILLLHPILFPVWGSGLLWFLRKTGFRVLGLTYVVFFGVMFALHAKHYYLFPIYPVLMAGGAAAIESWIGSRLWLKTAVTAAISLAGIAMGIFFVPILSPEKYLEYSRFLDLGQVRTETAHQSALPQFFADQFGWEELVKEVAAIYHSLPPEERKSAAIYAGNYGEAGAIDLFGPRYGLPPSICAHQNYYFWGARGYRSGPLIVLQSDMNGLQQRFDSVEIAGNHHHPYGMGEENGAIYLCRGPKFDINALWPRLKHWN